MKKGLTFFTKKTRTISQSTIPTIAAIAIIIVLIGTITTGVVVNVWAGTFPGPNGQIAFVRGEFEDPPLDEIYVMNSADGSEQIRLTNNDSSDIDPTWSPDGEKIAFASSSDGNFGIYVMNSADGSGITRLTADGFDPTWSPDGKKIAFTSTRDAKGGANNAIYVMNSADGSGVTRLTDTDAYYANPDWGTTTSPPGSGGSTPAQLIDKLISTIQNLDDDNVPQSVKTSLTALLKGASHILNDDNPNNDKAACGMLDAFIKLVNVDERHTMLTADQTDDLRTEAEDIRDALVC